MFPNLALEFYDENQSLAKKSLAKNDETKTFIVHFCFIMQLAHVMFEAPKSRADEFFSNMKNGWENINNFNNIVYCGFATNLAALA